VPYPGFGRHIGVVVSVGVMVTAVIALYVTFKRKDWL
jgi:Mg2+ and Co2+ transporter CorA